MINIQVFGENELIDYLNNNGAVYSHLISIGNPKNIISKQKPGQFLPDIFKTKFKKILRLEFFDAEKKEHLRKNEFPKRIPEISDIKKIINFYNSTKNEATGYTIHCWRGISRSAAVALCIIYMMVQSEEKAKQILQQIRPEAFPLRRIVELFDRIYGSHLIIQQEYIRKDLLDKMNKELNSTDVEELNPID